MEMVQIGKSQQQIIQDDFEFNQKNVRRIFLKNLGNSPVNFGLYELLPNQTHLIETGNLNLDEKIIEIKFTGSRSVDKKLFMEVIRFHKVQCNTN